MKSEKLKHQTHYVSPESPAGQPTKIDQNHASIEQGHCDPLTETQDGKGILSGHSQQPDEAPEEIGGEDERSVKPNQKLSLGRHVKSDDGFKKAESRKAHVKSARAENQKAFTTRSN